MSKFDPILIIFQIFSLQFVYYLFFSSCLLFFHFIYVFLYKNDLSSSYQNNFLDIDLLFDSSSLNYLFESPYTNRERISSNYSISPSDNIGVTLIVQEDNVYQHNEGWIVIFIYLLTGVFCAYMLSKIVEKSKKCVDFTFTLFFINLILTTIYSEFPFNWKWWTLHIITSVIMAALGEHFCVLNELEDIPLYSNRLQK